jgi:hypothetical protein
MMFPIMTEAQIKEADEQTLRQRVRDLIGMNSWYRDALILLRGIEDMQKRCLGALIELINIESRAARELVEMNAKRRAAPIKRRKGRKRMKR